MTERIRPNCIYRWNKPDGDSLFVYVTRNENGHCVVSPLDLVLDINQNVDVAAVDLESVYERPIPVEAFSDS